MAFKKLRKETEAPPKKTEKVIHTIKKVTKKTAPVVEEDDVDASKLKQTATPEPLRETIGLVGTGAVVSKFKQKCSAQGMSYSKILLKILHKFNEGQISL